jgi:pimeloyl-ACP methyl ester carboxylesterase
MRFLLVHSPATGPTTWRWMGERLGELGHRTTTPDLVEAARTGAPHEFVRRTIEAAGSDADLVLVGHSGAGPLLPQIASEVRSRLRALVFVDAGLPPCEGRYTVGGDFLGRLRVLAMYGLLPPWSSWFAPGMLEALVPGPDRRLAIAGELPRVPITFYETALVAPAGWCALPCRYVLLSESYRQDCEAAARRGWPVAERPGGHLDIATREVAICDLILSLV